MSENLAVGSSAIALVNGVPFTEIPIDLYIPPDALEVFLETFEGPLDLLLYLIRRQNLDILDIPIAAITKQYIAYIDMMVEMRMELAAEYLLMAAILAEIKSRLLLPRPTTAEAEEEDPRAELVRRLQEYERFKAAAEDLDKLPRCDRDVFELGGVDTSTVTVRKLYPEVDLQDVLTAFADVLRRADPKISSTVGLWKGIMKPIALLTMAATVFAGVIHYAIKGPDTVDEDHDDSKKS